MLLESFSYDKLVSDADLTDVAERAFGREGLGIVVVTGVPDIGESRRNMFELGLRFANLPEETRSRFEHQTSSFSFGWSHGKETLEAGRPDIAKGSFYANPCFDDPFADNPAEVLRHPSMAHPNVWPDEEVPEFSTAFKALGQAVVRVGTLVARQCDRYVAKVHAGYEKGKLERIISTSRCCKARFLHYFPRSCLGKDQRQDVSDGYGGVTAPTCLATEETRDGLDGGKRTTRAGGHKRGGWSNRNDDLDQARKDNSEGDSGRGVGRGDAANGGGGGAGTAEMCVSSVADDDGSFSDWCGWHHDHSSLTGLVPAMLFDAKGREVKNADLDCGLFIRSRQGVLVKAALSPGESPSSCLMFQIGETSQIHSGGALQATPHAVRSTSQPGISREAFAVFMQPEWAESMDTPIGTDMESTRSLHAASLLPREAAPIAKRLRPGMDFGAFTAATFASFY